MYIVADNTVLNITFCGILSFFTAYLRRRVGSARLGSARLGSVYVCNSHAKIIGTRFAVLNWAILDYISINFKVPSVRPLGRLRVRDIWVKKK